MIRIRRALFSAYVKDGLLPLAKEVARHGAEILSSGGTAEVLRTGGVAVTAIESWTGSPEMFGGRVKTLHPRVHGGILYRRDDAADQAQAAEHDIPAIDLVVVNLYPFGAARERGASFEDSIELIDVGGPAMVRAAAKNHAHVVVVTLPEDYEAVRVALSEHDGAIPEALARQLAARAFAVTSAYDAAIASYLEQVAAAESTTSSAGLPAAWRVSAPRVRSLRYGENPAQAGGLYGEGDGFPFDLEQLHGKELSYNNYLDLACGRDVVSEFGDSTFAVVIKHGIPCGAALGDDLASAYRAARDADPLSAFGGVVAMNSVVDAATAELLNETFLEAVLAPGFSPEALARLREKKNRVLLQTSLATLRARPRSVTGRFCGAGFLLQTALPDGHGESEWKITSKRSPDDRERRDLLFGWKVLKHVRSNGILFARGGRTVGIGSGQTSRIDSIESALRKARRSGHDLAGTVLVSDAFFPFRDSVDAAGEAGATAVLQPGGSLRDDETRVACDERDMALCLNDARIFSHG